MPHCHTFIDSRSQTEAWERCYSQLFMYATAIKEMQGPGGSQFMSCSLHVVTMQTTTHGLAAYCPLPLLVCVGHSSWLGVAAELQQHVAVRAMMFC